MQASLDFFPISRFEAGVETAGFTYKPTNKCSKCDKQCRKKAGASISTCSYNVQFLRLSKETLLFGFIVLSGNLSKQLAKTIRQNPESVLKPDVLHGIVSTYKLLRRRKDEDLNIEKAKIIQKYKDDFMYKRELLDLIRPEIQKNLAFLHDYKQFVSRVKQNINVILETRYPTGDLDNKISRALKEESAIYWLSAMMSEKLQTAFLLLNPERLEWEERQTFRLHGLVTKYMKIYGAAFKEKGVVLSQAGYSDGAITANAAAFSIIPHTLIDNALKYSQTGANVTIGFGETDDFISMTVTSFGPKIESDELHSIFEIFYRGRSAKLQEEEGVGFGLYLAQFVALDLGTKLTVQQKLQKLRFGYETEFGIRLRRVG